jgi:hypothetical protein
VKNELHGAHSPYTEKSTCSIEQQIIFIFCNLNCGEHIVHRNYISAKWYGFTDPQSGLDKLSWRVGTKPGTDDILRSTHLLVSNILVEPDRRDNIRKKRKENKYFWRCVLVL